MVVAQYKEATDHGAREKRREDVPESLQWSHPLRWVYPPTGKAKAFAVVSGYESRAYFDESGIHGKHGWCVVAGFVGTVRQWERFEGVWGPYAHSPGFHAKRFFARNCKGERVSPYGGWNDTRARRYFRELLKAIQVAEVDPVAVAVDLDAFWALSTEERDRVTAIPAPKGGFLLSGAPNKPYYLPFTEALARAVACQFRKNPKLSVCFLFDENESLKKRALRVYDCLKKRASESAPELAERMNGIAFQSDTDAIGLQASDLLAYTWFQAQSRGAEMSEELRPAMSIFLQRPDGGVASIWTKERMEGVLSGMASA